jgi:hypothetical protein
VSPRDPQPPAHLLRPQPKVQSTPGEGDLAAARRRPRCRHRHQRGDLGRGQGAEAHIRGAARAKTIRPAANAVGPGLGLNETHESSGRGRGVMRGEAVSCGRIEASRQGARETNSFPSTSPVQAAFRGVCYSEDPQWQAPSPPDFKPY